MPSKGICEPLIRICSMFPWALTRCLFVYAVQLGMNYASHFLPFVLWNYLSVIEFIDLYHLFTSLWPFTVWAQVGNKISQRYLTLLPLGGPRLHISPGLSWSSYRSKTTKIVQALFIHRRAATTTLLLLALKFGWINFQKEIKDYSPFHHLIEVKVKHVHKQLFNEYHIPWRIFIYHFVYLLPQSTW